MQRVSDGLDVPKHQTDIFSGKVTSAVQGDFVCELTYTPKGVNNIFMAIPWGAGYRLLRIYSLVGKTLTIIVDKLQYEKTDTPTGSTDAAGGGAVGEPHGHALSYTNTLLTGVRSTNDTLPPVAIHYEVA